MMATERLADIAMQTTSESYGHKTVENFNLKLTRNDHHTVTVLNLLDSDVPGLEQWRCTEHQRYGDDAKFPGRENQPPSKKLWPVQAGSVRQQQRYVTTTGIV